jgi:cystathionine gamma-synthase
MAAEIQTPAFTALPPAPRHAITIHIPLWSNLVKFMNKEPELIAQFKSMYPRIIPHKDVKEVHLLHCQRQKEKHAFPFPRPNP